MKPLSRRSLIKTMAGTAGASFVGIPLFSQTKDEATENQKQKQKLKIVVLGAHPDDPETICGGTMALFANAGHEVVSVYLTRGEAGIEGKSHEEAARIRTAEAVSACQLLKARPEFLGQIDGACEINALEYEKVREFSKQRKS
ncbi:MAG: PIG-L family deacetylase [Flavobacteriaceae bacterium]|nr:PIG-L family deacetylase [Flavobacteriaceae bacterium]